MNLKTDYIKKIGKKFRSKRGTTLIEMLATLAILAIVAVLSLQVVITAMEDYQCVRNISESQRSISLMQENFSKYLRNAVDIQLVDNSTSTFPSFANALADYVTARNGGADPLCDADTVATDEYNDYVLYRCGTFKYALAKYYTTYTKPDGTVISNFFVPVFTVDNIKEASFSFRSINGTSSPSNPDKQYMLDYVFTSPTNEEFRFIKGGNAAAIMPTDGSVTADANFIEAIANNTTKGDYSIMSGTILNNMYGNGYSTSTTTLRICEGITDTSGSNDGSFKNFIFIRTTPRVAI